MRTGWDMISLILNFFYFFSFNFIYYELQPIMVDINIYGYFIHGFKRDTINKAMLVPMDLY